MITPFATLEDQGTCAQALTGALQNCFELFQDGALRLGKSAVALMRPCVVGSGPLGANGAAIIGQVNLEVSL